MKNQKRDFVELSEVLRKKLKNPTFKKAFDEERERLHLAHELKMMRGRTRMTQKQVAAKAAMPQSVIARIESGNHSVSVITLGKIAHVFNKRIGFVGQDHPAE